MKVFMDGASVEDMLHCYSSGVAQGFTTNPTLMRKDGVTDYVSFALNVLAVIKDVSVSFEVFADDIDDMEAEAREIASWGKNVYVKIPVSNTQGVSTLPLVKKLLAHGISINITAILAQADIEATIDLCKKSATPSIVSIFAGRIADAGIDPVPVMKAAVERANDAEHVEILWASPREVFNLVQAEQVGCDIITCTPALINKRKVIGKDLKQFSLETVKMFYDDALAAGYDIGVTVDK
jgi:transaldolase